VSWKSQSIGSGIVYRGVKDKAHGVKGFGFYESREQQHKQGRVTWVTNNPIRASNYAGSSGGMWVGKRRGRVVMKDLADGFAMSKAPASARFIPSQRSWTAHGRRMLSVTDVRKRMERRIKKELSGRADAARRAWARRKAIRK
jgi:hypothetical protein